MIIALLLPHLLHSTENKMKPLITLGIETSCDETGAAVYHQDRGLLSHALFSQDQHKLFGGVIPELGSRAQLERINPIVESSLKQASLSLADIDVIAVTNRPGLPGSLLVGVCFAKALAWVAHKKIIGINHIEGHVFSPFLEFDVPFPHICLTSSGGHTSIFLVKGFGDFQVLGETSDDAAGEAFDKVAKMLNLPYPGGPEIEKLAAQADFKDYFHYPRTKQKTLDFSYSGLKTAVLYDLIKKGAYDIKTKKFISEDENLKSKIASSFLVCMSDIFIEKLERAIVQYPSIKAVTFVGGVSRNKYIRASIEQIAQKHELPLFIPSPQYCTDNGAMIALVGNYKAIQGKFSDLYLDIER
jgi:N6-L-threonylcarbamoyladenine synthase